MQKNIIISIIASMALIGASYYFISNSPEPSSGGAGTRAQNVEIKDGIQYVTIVAKDGYAPRLSQIQAGLPTKLVVKTNGTYDCSASLVIRSVGYQKILQSTGEEIIDVGTLKSGDRVQGVCGMGMYSFQVSAS